MIRRSILILVSLCALAWALPAAPTSAKAPKPAGADAPVFAYYYIWFNPTSWQRAKTDYPAIGRYSSDERDVMRKHIRWAKQAGINGFIVSWKSTEVLNRRLAKLIQVATQENFSLAIIYQGLDFSRNPLPVSQVASDFDFFNRQFAHRKPFRFFRKPVMIWSGTWKFSRDEIGFVTRPRRDKLLILATARDIEDYERVADLVDGNAYYWSSVNPDTFPGYPQRLKQMGDAVHARGDLWFAPAAPGFDALLIGGSTVVERKGGDTLRREYNAAIGSSPDVVGLISWNEFSENSQIEPSERYGARYLRVLADIRGAKAPKIQSFDSSNEPASTAKSYGPFVIGAAALILLALIAYVLRRRVETPRHRHARPRDSRAD
jgi:glycosyl hydrolase family 99